MTKISIIQITGLELRGAYGRETKMEDWRSGKDFKIVGGPYCSNRDAEEMKKHGVSILEFTNHDGSLVERIILSDELLDLVGEVKSVFLKAYF